MRAKEGGDLKLDKGEFVIRIVPSFGDFTREEWDQLSGTSRGASDTPYNPFVSYDFLSALEDSGCAARATGWQGQHLRLEAPDGSLLGAVPCYLKSHSQGEYVFDHGWADAFERAGGRYYPKLQASVPFTPATGPRLLARRGTDEETVRAALAAGLKALTDQIGASSAHVTFAREPEAEALEEAGFLRRNDQQFHFFNEGYGSYDDFLASLASRKRKALKKERRTAVENGIDIEWLTGSDLTEAVWDDFFRFYMDTGSRKWGRPYLNRRYYSLIGERMADDILLVMARRNGRFIAGAINFIGGDTLFGRNWGCVEDHPFLHFEVCYHQAIDFAIDRKLKVVEAGAQGEHKLARGYMPVKTHSAHYLAHPGLRRAVADYLVRERAEVTAVGEYLEERGPFRKG
ncbi:GNAT family N-acetyltransferase [Aquibium oceanicum]|uniref:GNAT family N-acetyltransferase n=1 Tax=Aquibium oceanicum TaxID=1670800 RepID=A0A1L3SSW4_9HYPH|nr:GNAT family N-acetyltransferase [Aquibium oceanicum]APH72488.1 GNAT family N-acetyltransferase [Aquibium oceanicum]